MRHRKDDPEATNKKTHGQPFKINIVPLNSQEAAEQSMEEYPLTVPRRIFGSGQGGRPSRTRDSKQKGAKRPIPVRFVSHGGAEGERSLRQPFLSLIFRHFFMRMVRHFRRTFPLFQKTRPMNDVAIHDRFFKSTLGVPERLGSVLRASLPRWAAASSRTPSFPFPPNPWARRCPPPSWISPFPHV